jgi:putative transposase
MRDLNQRTSAWHNKTRKTKGLIWGHRFYNKVIGDDQHLLTTMAYCDLNPVRAGMVARAGDFKFGYAGKLQLQLERSKTGLSGHWFFEAYSKKKHVFAVARLSCCGGQR